MNHQRIYNKLIEMARSKFRSKNKEVYYECHHILPECWGGSDEEDNLVLLTAREHFIAHKLLYYIAPSAFEKYQMASALKRFIHSKKFKLYNICSRQYELIKTNHAKLMSEINTGRVHTKEAKENMALAQRKYFETHSGHWSGKTHTDETKEKMSIAQTGANNHMFGFNHTLESRNKISVTMMGHKKSPETISKFKQRKHPESKKKQISESLKRYHALKKAGKWKNGQDVI